MTRDNANQSHFCLFSERAFTHSRVAHTLFPLRVCLHYCTVDEVSKRDVFILHNTYSMLVILFIRYYLLCLQNIFYHPIYLSNCTIFFNLTGVFVKMT